jgi:hypothetical protein
MRVVARVPFIPWFATRLSVSKFGKRFLERDSSTSLVCLVTALVRFLDEDVSAHARIAYRHGSSDLFVVGLQFSAAIDPWIPPAARLTLS